MTSTEYQRVIQLSPRFALNLRFWSLIIVESQQYAEEQAYYEQQLQQQLQQQQLFQQETQFYQVYHFYTKSWMIANQTIFLFFVV